MHISMKTYKTNHMHGIYMLLYISISYFARNGPFSFGGEMGKGWTDQECCQEIGVSRLHVLLLCKQMCAYVVNNLYVGIHAYRYVLHIFGAFAKVTVLTPDITRDAIKDNIRVLSIAGQELGLRVGVKTCQVHVQALYELMSINCPGQVFVLHFFH